MDRHRRRHGTPAVIQYIHGPAGLEPTSVAVTGSNISWTYNLTVPAGQTVTLAYFTIVSPTRRQRSPRPTPW